MAEAVVVPQAVAHGLAERAGALLAAVGGAGIVDDEIHVLAVIGEGLRAGVLVQVRRFRAA